MTTNGHRSEAYVKVTVFDVILLCYFLFCIPNTIVIYDSLSLYII
ncbi:hypothetical protein KL86DYS2_11294 [uncultured Dysgonomonas sp.]|uniref:Uncharacterized protein n=1 Tax=uncultured Dysgonomonas sp. TaxID=206096 RepID=A0A212JDP1_9BACT|nr:hypothetical protein KL86DYS2_11294 [uncultured Dysgonomonas sp.]